MRIAQLANFYTPVSGGLRTCISQNGQGYVAAGHDRLLIVPGPADEDRTTEHGRQVTIGSNRIPGSGGYRVITNRSRVLAALESWHPDVLEVNDKISVGWLSRWARKRGVPLVMFSHERLDAVIRVRVSRGLAKPGAATLNRRLHHLADRIVVASDYSAEEFLRFGSAKVRLARLGVDLDVFDPSRRSARPDDGVARLVMVSRLSREKAPELAVEAVRELTGRGVPVRLDVIGDGPLRRRLQKRAEGLPITFVGHVRGREQLAGMVASADVALSPCGVETFGLATLEAMACGVPVVVPRLGAAAELVTMPGSGQITDGTASGLADGVQALLSLPEAHRRAQARAAAEKLPWSSMTNAMLACFEELTSPAPLPAVAQRRPRRAVPSC